MCKHVLLAAALGAVAILPAPASAHGHGPVHPNLVSSFDLRIILRDGPKLVHRHHPPHRYVRPHPGPLKFKGYTPSPRWRQPRRHQGHYFHWRDHDHRHHFKRGHHEGWLHAPAQRAKFKHREHRYGSRRHH